MDKKVLGVHRHGQIELQVCRDCNGVWLTHEQLATNCVSGETLPPASRRKPEAPRSHRTIRRACSQCVVPLRPQVVESVEIDLCPVCGGIWLDPGEFDAVHNWHITRSAKRGTGAKLPGTGTADGLDAGAEALHIAGEAAANGLAGEIIEFLCEIGGGILGGP